MSAVVIGRYRLSRLPSQYVNVRAAPTVTAQDRGDLHRGDVVTLTGAAAGDWREVITDDGVRGWVSGQGGAVGFEPLEVEPWTYQMAVPYVSQQGAGANYRLRDCGAACAVMVARDAYMQSDFLDPVFFTVDDFARKTTLATKDTGLTCPQIVALLAGYGLKAEARTGLSLDLLQAWIRGGIAPIVLVNYRHIHKAHPANLGHFLVLVGYRADAFLAHDPYLLGANVTVSNGDLSRAMHDVLMVTQAPYQGVVLA